MIPRFIAVLFGVAICLAWDPARAAQGEPGLSPPNIVFVLADDLGWTDLGCMGSRYYETPNIDRLAREGLRFEAFYVYQNCAPTRAALMSGQYSPRTGVYTVGSLERGREEHRRMITPANATRLPLDRVTVAEVLQKAGYATGMFGKWHLGQSGGFHPAQRGFDEAFVNGGRSHVRFTMNPARPVPEGVYLADYLTELGVQFMRRYHDRPFFLYLPHFGVHSPYQAKPELISHYQAKPSVDRHDNPTYAAMIHSLDDSVGRILTTLAELGLDDNTVVIFSSDNGGVGGYYQTEPPSKKRGITDNAPLRGGKGTLYEGGIRVPFLVRWPATIPGGASCSEPGAHVDILPTFCDLARAALPGDQPIDGQSLVPWFMNPDRAPSGRSLFWHFPGYLESYVHTPGWRTTPVGVIRQGRFKLMDFFELNRRELYDLDQDPGETTDLAATSPTRVAELSTALALWRQAVDAAMPTPKN